MRFFVFALFICLMLPAFAASIYSDAKLPVKLKVPSGWKVRVSFATGKRQIRVIPPKADQRERAAIHVAITLEKIPPKQVLSDYADEQKQGKQQIMRMTQPTKSNQRLEIDYRGGRYVTSKLWIMQRSKVVLQRVDATHLIAARCSANLAEYSTYRRVLESICKSIQLTHK